MSATTITLIILVFALGLALGAGLILFLLRRERRTTAPAQPEAAPAPRPAPVVRFHASFIVLPLAIAASSIIVALILFPSLPAQVAYRFTSSGAPSAYMARGTFLALMVAAQLVILFAAYVIAQTIVKMGQRMAQGQPLPVDPTRVIWLMANMVVLPQVILAFIMVDAAVYAAAGYHLMAPWLFALIAIAVGSAVIVFLFLRSFRDYRK